ncbi:MAG: matrixin family metalloprotease [Chloroflexota bacterium]
MVKPNLPIRIVLAAAAAGTLLLSTGAASSAAAPWVVATDGDPVAGASAGPQPEVHAFEIHILRSRLGHAPRATARHAQAIRARALALVAPASSPSPCVDKKYSFGTGAARAHWQQTFNWYYRVRTTPDNLSDDAVIKTLKRSVRNIVNAHNDCGHADKVGATAVYQGTTDRTPAPTDKGTCDSASQDGKNVIGFGRLPAGIAGLTCVWSIGDRIIEADIKLDRRAKWATSLAACSVQSIVEAVATHEFGHAFGLGHVPEATHGRLTMSERLDGYCQDAEATLGKGDWLGLEALY